MPQTHRLVEGKAVLDALTDADPIDDALTGGSATAALNATAINAILEVLRAAGLPEDA